MQKIRLLAIIFIISCLLAACSDKDAQPTATATVIDTSQYVLQGNDGQKQDAPVATDDTDSSEFVSDNSVNGSKDDAVFTPDTNIPDAKPDDKTVANANSALYESTDNIYYMLDGVYRIGKDGKNIKRLTGDCVNFTFYNGDIFCVESSGASIKKYDATTGQGKAIITGGKGFGYIAAYGNNLYYTESTAADADSVIQTSALKSASLNGNQITTVVKDAYSFGIYKDKIYYTGSGGDETGPLYVCGLHGTNVKTISKDPVEWNFLIGSDTLLYADNSVYGIGGRDVKAMPEGSSFVAMYGQYAVYVKDNPTQLYAFDVTNGKSYALLDVSGISDANNLGIYSGSDCVYVVNPTGQSTADFYRLTIKAGKAELTQIATMK